MLRWVFSAGFVCVGSLVFVVGANPLVPPQPQPVEFSHKAHLEYFRDGRHRREMIAMHEEMALKDIGDTEPVAEVGKRSCSGCHRDFDENANDLARLARCGECHRALIDRDWEGRAEQKPCMGCHSTVADLAHASIPNSKTCAACHLPPRQGGPEESKLWDFVQHERSLPWVRVYDYLPGDIVFSHERHVEMGRVPCRECHGQVAEAERTLSLQVKLSMEDCTACHTMTGASNDCMACHK